MNGTDGVLLETKIKEWIKLDLWSGKTSKEVTWGMTGRMSRSKGRGVLQTEDSMCKGPEVVENMMLSLSGEMNCRRLRSCGFHTWVRKIPWRRTWQPTPVYLPGESPWTEEPGGLQSTGLQRVGHEQLCTTTSLSIHLWWTSTLPPCPGYCKKCCSEDVPFWIVVFSGICWVVGLLGHMVVYIPSFLRNLHSGCINFK